LASNLASPSAVKTIRHASPQEPFDAFSGSRYTVVEDPDGNLVGLKSPR
jgi:hypothetical protein